MTNLWAKNNQMDVDDVWDDSELIKMYEQSIQEVHNQTRGVTEKKCDGVDGKSYIWKVGGKCMAPYEENGEISYFPATIDSIGGPENSEVAVTFLGYGNSEVVPIKELFHNQEAIADAEKIEKKTKKGSEKLVQPTSSVPSTSQVPLPTFAPPVPPNIVGMVPASQQEAMSSMLMSWYMSGYHTGYYQAMADRNS